MLKYTGWYDSQLTMHSKCIKSFFIICEMRSYTCYIYLQDNNLVYKHLNLRACRPKIHMKDYYFNIFLIVYPHNAYTLVYLC